MSDGDLANFEVLSDEEMWAGLQEATARSLADVGQVAEENTFESDMQLATELSLQAQGGQHAELYQKVDSILEECGPFQRQPITAGGWCFYEVHTSNSMSSLFFGNT